MKKLLFLFTLSLLLVSMAWGQTPFTATYTFTGTTGDVSSFTYNGQAITGVSMSNIEKFGVTTSSSTSNFRATGWPTDSSADTGKYIGFTITAAAGYKFTVNTINFGVGRSQTGTRDSQWRGSADSYAALINNYTTLNGSLTNNSGVLNNPDSKSNWAGNVLTLGSSYANVTESAGFRVYLYTAESTGGTAGLAGPLTITGTYELDGGSPTPTIVTNPTYLSDFTYVFGSGPSTAQSFSVTGENLTGNLSVSSSETDYVISATEGGTYGTSLDLDESDGNVSATVYVKLKSGLAIGVHNNQTITVSGGDATSQTVTCSGSVTAPPASAQVLLRPTQISIGDASHESAIFMKVDNYASNDYRYRLYNGSSQYRPWDTGTETWISSTSYSSGPQIPGTPSSSVTWWIPFQIGSNTSTNATYRDRQGTAYSSDNQTIALPSATSIITPVSIQKSDVTFSTWSDYSARLVVLAYDDVNEGTLIAAASTAPTTGDFTVYVENGTIIRRIEIRDVMNTLLEAVTGTWPEPDPSVVLSTGALEGFYYYDGNGPSGEKSFTVSGAHLEGNITITPPTNYEISTVSGEGFIATNPITVTETDGSASGTIHVRLKAGLDVGTHDQNITVSSTGTADQSVSCSGMVHKSVPSNHVSDFTVDTGTLSWSAIDMIWWDPTSGTIPDAYLIKGSTIGYGDISAPVNGVPEANSALVQNVGAGVENHSFAELLAETTYYFKIFPYTNSGEFIQYKTDGVVPEESATTGSEPITLAYWNFNSPPPSGNWQQPIASDPGTGAITYSFADAVSFGGTTVNGTDAEVNGGSFVPQGGTDLGGGVFANNGEYFEIAASTEGFENIVLSYATQRTSTGFSSQAIYYSTDGENYTFKETITDIPSSWAIRAIDFSGIAGVPNNPNFQIKIILDGASTTAGNNRFDNIQINGYALPPYDIDPGTPADIGGVDEETTITITGGGFLGANYITPGEGFTYTPVANAAFIPTSEGILELIGTGEITITVSTDQPWFVYLEGGNWVQLAGPLTDYPINVDLGAKDASFEFKSGGGGEPTLPVELSTFTVALNNYNNAVLTWVTQTETGVSGFYVFRNTEESLATAEMVSNLIPATNTSQQQVYLFTDKELGGPGTYYYWLQVSDMDGSDSFYGPITLVYQGGNEPGIPSIPQVTELKSIYPNPFNPSTTISYGLAEAADVKVQIFNSRGQLVRSISEGQRNAGNYNLIWNGTDNNGQSQPTGVYFVRLHAGKKVFNSKAVLMK
ncbi:MAG: FlgD immunoglobulin-like domain containing protein [Candidatus Cloacimonetes bacterium]|nr:FlgD immunoglobulin-like domain containing protein [Candidatus Cloacimonadota bacterium]